MASLRALHLAPHPDDEILGCGATLRALIAAGHDVVNLAASLGRRSERDERRQELETACERAGIRSRSSIRRWRCRAEKAMTL